MQRIDAHVHFWKFDPIRDGWITEKMEAIRTDFLPPQLSPLLEIHHIGGSIAIQADSSETETDFMITLAREYKFIKAVVGWVDFNSANMVERLQYYADAGIVKGFRHIIQTENSAVFMTENNFLRGIRALKRNDFSYDLLISRFQIRDAERLCRLFPDQRFVIDHLAKPDIKSRDIKKWRNDMKAISRLSNVYCKISGMVTEADWGNWKAEDLEPYLDTVFEAFGTDRIMYGSDWPVCLLASPYAGVYNSISSYLYSLTYTEQEKIFGLNAKQFYRVNQ
jgi:L-fuconolactonase